MTKNALYVKHITMQNLSLDSNEDVIRIPPFEDSHMHFTLAGRPASTQELKGIMDACERYGIFSLKDMGHKSGINIKREGSILPGEAQVVGDGFHYIKAACSIFLFRPSKNWDVEPV